MRVVSDWKLLISVVAFTLHVVRGTIVKDATLSNIAFENARKSNVFNSNVTEFRPGDIIFTENKPHKCLDFLKLLAETQYGSSIMVYSSKGSESLQNFIESEPTSNFRLVQNHRTLAFLEIAAMLDMREVSFIRPTHLNVNGNSIPLSNAIDIYASDLKPSIAVRYMNNDEYFFYENERVGATQLYNIIFQRPNYVYDFSSLELNGMKIPFETILYTLTYMPNLKIIHEGEKFDAITFMTEYPKYVGKLQLELEGVIDDLIDVFKKVLKYTVVDFITVPTGMVPPYHALRSLQHLSELEAWRPGPGNNPEPILLFLQDVYPDEDPKQNLIQVLYRGALVSVQSFIQLLLTEGHIVFGDMAHAEKLPRDQDYVIRYDNDTFPIDSFLTTYGRTGAYYEIIKGSKVLTLKQLDALKESPYSIPAKKPEVSIVSKYDVSFRNSELAYNLAQQKPRHVMIVYDGVSYTPEQFVHIFRDQMPEEFTVQQNGINVSLHEIFKIIDINLTPQFLKLYKVMNVPHKGQIYTKDDILVAILENPEGFMIFDNEQFKSPINFKEHYGDNVPEYVIYYKNMPIKPQDIPKYLDLEAILEEEFYPILYNGNTYQPRDVVNMFYNQQPDKVKILHKEKQYTPEEYKDQFPSTKFQVLYNDYPIQAQDLEQILDFDLKNPKSQLRFFTIKYKGVSYTKKDIIDILIEQSPPNIKILHDGVFYLPKQFKRKFGSNIPFNFAVVQNRRIIPSKLLPTIVRLGNSKKTNPKIFPNIIYGGKEYTPDDILQLIITQNPPGVTIALRNKKFTPKQFERTYDGVYPITFSILFKNTVITPEEIVNIVDFETPETTEPPKIIIYTTQRGQNWIPTATTSISSESTKSVEASTSSTEKTIKIVEEDDLTTIGGKPEITSSKYSQENSEASKWAESEVVPPGMHHKENLPRGGQPPENIHLKVEDVGFSKNFDKSKDFPYIVHDGTLYPPADVVKSMAELITKGILPKTWNIHHENTEYSPVEFIAKIKPIPRNFEIFKGKEKISPERVANLINLKNYGFMINEEMSNGKIFPHLVINGVIYTPQDVLHCLITKSSNETYILHQGRTYHPKTFQEEYKNQPLPNFDVVVGNETISKEKLLSIVNLDEESFLTTAVPPQITPFLIASPTFVSDEDFSHSSRDEGAPTVSDNYLSIEKQYTLTKEPNITTNQPMISSEKYTESMASTSASSYDLSTEAPITATAKPFPYIVYNGSIFSPYEVVKTLRDQKPENVTIVADHQEYTPEEFYDHYVTDSPEHFKIFQGGNYVSPPEIPKIVNFDSSTYESYDYEYEDRAPATPKPTVSTNIIKQILKDNPNTRVVLEGREYEPEEIDDWDKIHIGQKDVKIVDVEPAYTAFLPKHENYLRELNKTPKGKDITITHDDKPYTLENFLKLFQNRIPENIRVVDGSKDIPIEKVKDLLLPFRDEKFQSVVSPVTPRVDNEHNKAIPGNDQLSPIAVFISNEDSDLEEPDFASIKRNPTHYTMSGVTGTEVPGQADVNSSQSSIKNFDFDSVKIEPTYNPMSNHSTTAKTIAENDAHESTDDSVTNQSSTISSYSSEENYVYQKYTPSSKLTIEEIINAHPTEIPAKNDPSGVHHGTTPRHADYHKPSDDAFLDDGDFNDFTYDPTKFITSHHRTDRPQKLNVVEHEYSTEFNDNIRTTSEYNWPIYVVNPKKSSTEAVNINEQPLNQKSDESLSKIPINKVFDQSSRYLPHQSTATYISKNENAEIGKYPDTTTNYKNLAETSPLSTETYNQSDEEDSETEQTGTILNYPSKHRDYLENVHKQPIYSSMYDSPASDEINRPEYPNHKAATQHPIINDRISQTESTIKAEFTNHVPARTDLPVTTAITTPRNSQISDEMVEVPTQHHGYNPSIPTKSRNPKDPKDYKLSSEEIIPTIPYSSKNITSTMPTRPAILEEYESVPNAPIIPHQSKHSAIVPTKSHHDISNMPKEAEYPEDLTTYDDKLQYGIMKPTIADNSIAFSQQTDISSVPRKPELPGTDNVLSSEIIKLTPQSDSAYTTIPAPTKPHHEDLLNIPIIPKYAENIDVDYLTLTSDMAVIPNSNVNNEISLPTKPFSTPRFTMSKEDDLISTDVHKPTNSNGSKFAIPTASHYGYVPSIPTTSGYSEENDIYDFTQSNNMTNPMIPFSSQLQQLSAPTRPQTPAKYGSEIHRPTYLDSSEHSTIPVPQKSHHNIMPNVPSKPVHPEFSNIYDETLPNSITRLVMPDSIENIPLHQQIKPSTLSDMISTKPNKPIYSDNSEYSTVPTQPHLGRIVTIPTKPEYSDENNIYKNTLQSNIEEPKIPQKHEYIHVHQPTKHPITKIKPRLPEGYDITSAESDRQTYSGSSEYSTIPIPINPHHSHVPNVPMKPGNFQLTDIYNISLPNGITRPTVPDSSHYIKNNQPIKASTTPIRPIMQGGSDSSSEHSTILESSEEVEIHDVSLPSDMTRPTLLDSSQYINEVNELTTTTTPTKLQMQEQYASEPNRSIYQDSSEHSTIPVPIKSGHIPGKSIKPGYTKEDDIYVVSPLNGMTKPTKPNSSQYIKEYQQQNRPIHQDSSEYSNIPIPTKPGHILDSSTNSEYLEENNIYEVLLSRAVTRPTILDSSQYIEVHQPTKSTRRPSRPQMPKGYVVEPNSALPVLTKPGHIYEKPSKPGSIIRLPISEAQYTEAKPTSMLSSPQMPEKYDSESSGPTYSSSSEHSTTRVPTIPRTDHISKPTIPHTEGIEVYQPSTIPIIPTMLEEYDMISAGHNRPKYPYSSEPITMPVPTRPYNGNIPGKRVKPAYQKLIDIYDVTLPGGIITPSMLPRNENIDVSLPTKPSTMSTKPVDIYNVLSRIKSPLNIPSSRDQRFEEYSIENFDKLARPISLDSIGSTNYPNTWLPENPSQLNKFIDLDSPTTVDPLYTMAKTGHLGELLFTTPTAPTIYYEENETTPISPISKNPIRPTSSTSHNSLIVTDEGVLDTIDIIHNLAAHNPNRVDLLYKDNLYKPEAFIRKYPYLPYNPDVKYVIGNKVVSPFEVASQFPPKPKSSNDTGFPNVIKDGHTYSPKDVLKEISHNPEGQCVEVIYDGQLYTPQQFYDFFQSKLHFPNNFQMQVSGQPLDPKLFLSIFKVFGKTEKNLNNQEINMIENDEVGPPYIAKWSTTTQKPNVVRTYIHKVMSKEPNFMIFYEDNTYDPLEYLQVFEENAPGNFKIVYEDKILTPKSFYQLIKHRPPTNDHKIPDQQFPTVLFEGQQYSPRLVLESLAVSNPNHVKVKHQEKLYSPMQLIASFNIIPTAFELVDSTGNTINPMHTSKYLPASFDSGRKSAPIENNNFPTIVSNGEIFTPREILVNIKKSGSNVLVRLKSGRILSAWQVLSMQAMPETFDLIMNEKKIEPIEIARIIKLQKY